VSEARGGGIPRVSLDLILATPGQTLAEQEEDLRRAVALSPDHVSAYVLTIEEGTAFASWVKHGLLAAPDEERDLEHLRLARRVLEEAGLCRYEVSNFARPGHESRHNLGYWRNAEWLGVGAGAHSHVRGARWRNEPDPARYARAVAARGEAVVEEERPGPTTALFETIMMGLRLAEGVDLEAARRATGIDARASYRDAIARHVGEGLLVLDGARLRLTDRGFELASYVTRSFL
jgi:oxygen-independent coproporphyrinogen-3 oxidase